MTPTQSTYNDIMERAATLCDVDIYSAHNGRSHKHARVRRIAWFVLAEHLGWRRNEIARHCKWDRVTVLMGVNSIGDLSSQSEEAAIVRAIINSLGC